MQNDMQVRKSPVFKIQTNLLAALVLFVPALVAWIPYLGYFAWALPLVVFIIDGSSNFVRFCAAQSFCIAIIRLVIDVAFDIIIAEAKVCAEAFSADAAYVQFWGTASVPGLGAIIISSIFCIILTLATVYPAYAAYKRRLLKIPVITDIAEKVTNSFRIKTRRKSYHN